MRNMSQSRQSNQNKEGFRDRIRKTIVQRFNFSSVKFGFCPICTLDFVTGDRIYQLGCHETHVLHESCYDDYAKFNKDKGKSLLCPVCRVPVDDSKVVKSELQIAGQKSVGDAAMFDDKQQVGAGSELMSMPPMAINEDVAPGDGVIIDAPVDVGAADENLSSAGDIVEDAPQAQVMPQIMAPRPGSDQAIVGLPDSSPQ